MEEYQIALGLVSKPLAGILFEENQGQSANIGINQFNKRFTRAVVTGLKIRKKQSRAGTFDVILFHSQSSDGIEYKAKN